MICQKIVIFLTDFRPFYLSKDVNAMAVTDRRIGALLGKIVEYTILQTVSAGFSQ